VVGGANAGTVGTFGPTRKKIVSTRFRGLFPGGSREEEKKPGLIFHKSKPFWGFFVWGFFFGVSFCLFGLICSETAHFQIVTATHFIRASLNGSLINALMPFGYFFRGKPRKKPGLISINKPFWTFFWVLFLAYLC
jgi:hypothetical protein